MSNPSIHKLLLGDVAQYDLDHVLRLRDALGTNTKEHTQMVFERQYLLQHLPTMELYLVKKTHRHIFHLSDAQRSKKTQAGEDGHNSNLQPGKHHQLVYDYAISHEVEQANSSTLQLVLCDHTLANAVHQAKMSVDGIHTPSTYFLAPLFLIRHRWIHFQ